MDLNTRLHSAVELLKSLINIPSYSYKEEEVADFLYGYLIERMNIEGFTEVKIKRLQNNVLLEYIQDKQSETLMLCAHIDTVLPSDGYTIPPHEAVEEHGKIYGLGSNDDGGSVVAMIEAFFHCVKNKDLQVNLILALTAEEECSGPGGMEYVISKLREAENYPTYAIIGEPTKMKAAIAERGLLVIDARATGVSGHAARNEGENALYKAIEDISIIRNIKFSKISEIMGEVKMTVTQLNSGKQHNVIPDLATFVIDIRPTESYSNQEILEILKNKVESELLPRNLKNKASITPEDSKLMEVVRICGIETFVSPTTSDWIRIGEMPAVKMGVGDSSRSHRPNEYVTKEEILDGIKGYIKFIENIL